MTNVIPFKRKPALAVTIWDRLHMQEFYNAKLEHLVEEGLIESGICAINEDGVPLISVKPPQGFIF